MRLTRRAAPTCNSTKYLTELCFNVEILLFSDPFEDIVVDVSSTKVNAVLKQMEIVRREHPEEKIIVVSQFTSFLSIIQVCKLAICSIQSNTRFSIVVSISRCWMMPSSRTPAWTAPCPPGRGARSWPSFRIQSKTRPRCSCCHSKPVSNNIFLISSVYTTISANDQQ